MELEFVFIEHWNDLLYFIFVQFHVIFIFYGTILHFTLTMTRAYAFHFNIIYMCL